MSNNSRTAQGLSRLYGDVVWRCRWLNAAVSRGLQLSTAAGRRADRKRRSCGRRLASLGHRRCSFEQLDQRVLLAADFGHQALLDGLVEADPLAAYASEFQMVTVERRVNAGSDDAEERASGNMYRNSSDLELVADGGGNQTVGMRFSGMSIPQGASIVNAYVQFQADESHSVATSLAVQGHDTDHAPTFTSGDGNISSRARTTASVAWSPAPWTAVGEAGPDQRTPDVSSVIQEIVNRPNWSSGNSLAIIITGTGERTAESYNGDQGAAPLLHVEYTTDDPPTNQPPVLAPIGDKSVVQGNTLTFTASATDPDVPPDNLTFSLDAGAPATATIHPLTGQFSWTPTGANPPGDYTVTVRVTDDGTSSLSDWETITITVIEGGSVTTLEKRIVARSDDAEERASGSVRLNSSDLELVADGGGNQTVGMRFRGMDIPQGASIVSAYVQFQVDESNSVATSLTVQGHDTDNAPNFTNSNGSISSRARTTAGTAWSPVPWTTVGAAGPDQRTPNIASVIQEIVNRPNWSSGNALAIIITGTGERTAESYNGNPGAAPLLHVEYTTGDPPSNQPPVLAPIGNQMVVEENTLNFTATATDPDVPPDTLSFSLDAGAPAGAAINSITGIFNWTPSPAQAPGTYPVTVRVTDDGTPTLSDFEAIAITVTEAGTAQPITFRVMGDVPYSSSQLPSLEADLANVSSEDEFFVHVGDIKSGSSPCVASAYTSVASSLETSTLPVFVIPGDNEWNDCADPDSAWALWETHLSRMDENWPNDFGVTRQSVRDENFAFVRNQVLFIGINLVGGAVHDAAEWSQRMTDDANWVNQNFASSGSQVTSAVVFGHAFPGPNGGDRHQFAVDFVQAAQDFGKPILYMQGDLHSWLVDQPYSNAPNITRVVVDEGVPSVRVTVSDDAMNPFTFDQTPYFAAPSNFSLQFGAEPLEADQPRLNADEPVRRLPQSADPDATNALVQSDLEVVNLPGNRPSRTRDGAIQIGVDAARSGWFIDTILHDELEFQFELATDPFLTLRGSPVDGRFDAGGLFLGRTRLFAMPGSGG